MLMTLDVKYCVDLIESERRRYRKVLSSRHRKINEKYFETLEEADNFIIEFNSKNNECVESYLIYASGSRRVIFDTEGNKYELRRIL